jgi:cyclopropane fatty-acyl-phospholipid synthase-like methyltransferase
MNPEEKALKEKLTAFYESAGTLAWNRMTNGNVHFGYWDETREDLSLADATANLTRLMIGKTTILPGQLFCDIGCGVGIPAIALAKEKNCTVHGVTIVESQKNEADRNARAHGAEDRTRFFSANALALPFKDNSYDGAWFFESIFHMGHEAALKEACRILKPSATLVIADMTDIGVLTGAEKRAAVEINNSVCLAKEEYPALLERTGFELIELSDITEKVLGVFEHKLVEAVEAHAQTLSGMVDYDLSASFLMLIRQIKRTLGYCVVTARKIGS